MAQREISRLNEQESCTIAKMTARCTIVQSAVLRSHVVCLSVTLVDHDHIGWKSLKLIARTISPTSSLFVAQRSSRGTWRNLGTKCLVNTYVHNVRLKWVNRESRDRRWRCGCLLLSAHRAVIFEIAQLSCLNCSADSTICTVCLLSNKDDRVSDDDKETDLSESTATETPQVHCRL